MKEINGCKIGDIVFAFESSLGRTYENSFDFFKIVGETKTQWRLSGDNRCMKIGGKGIGLMFKGTHYHAMDEHSEVVFKKTKTHLNEVLQR